MREEGGHTGPRNGDRHLICRGYDDNTFLFSFCLGAGWAFDCFGVIPPALVLPFPPRGVMPGSMGKVTRGSRCWKAIAWLFISGFVHQGGHTRYLVHAGLWHPEEVRLLYGVAFLSTPRLRVFFFVWCCQRFTVFSCPESVCERERVAPRRTDI